jgi:hypothetical protein
MTLNIDNLRYPDWDEARYADWSEREPAFGHDGGDEPWSYVATSTVTVDDILYRADVTVVWRNGDVVGFVDPLTKEYAEPDFEEWAADYDMGVPEDDDAAGEREEARRWAIVDAIQHAENNGAPVAGVEGPMMNYAYPVTSEVDADVSAQWAVRIAGLPLCVVELDGYTGLALTGGGTDLSWEIAEAFIRIGYYPPLGVCSDLPAMADKRAPLNEDDTAIVQAVIIHLNRRAALDLAAADRLRDAYLNTAQTGS